MRIFFDAALCGGEPRIVHLEPPQISKETVLEQLVCNRPARTGQFNISLEERQGKTIVNCYGHGGSGWTTLFGSVNRAIELYKNTQPDPHTPIRIIGSGCMGLTTAIELTRLGYSVVGISTKSLYDIPSWKAGGYFALTFKDQEQARVKPICLQTFLTYQTIAQGEHPYLTQEGVKLLPVYCNNGFNSGAEDFEERGLLPPKENVTLDFGNGVIRENFGKHMSYFMNTTELMRQLTKEVQRLNIGVEIKAIGYFSEVAEDVIFNCSGLGGRRTQFRRRDGCDPWPYRHLT